jgi:hypothetical protein
MVLMNILAKILQDGVESMNTINMQIFNTQSRGLKYIRAHGIFMSDRYKKCLPAVLSQSLKDETMFHPWMKVYCPFILG